MPFNRMMFIFLLVSLILWLTFGAAVVGLVWLGDLIWL